MPTLPDEPDPSGTGPREGVGLLEAILDAIHKEDDRIGGRAVTRLAAPLPAGDTSGMVVTSTIGFGEQTDGTGDALLLVGGEIIAAQARRSRHPFQFETLTRGLRETEDRAHPEGTLVFDLSMNTSAIDRLRRGFLVDFAVGEDLEIIARNLGLHRCPGMTQEQLRRVIKAVAYLPKQPLDAFEQALTALLGSSSAFHISERTSSRPWTVFVDIEVDLAADIRGRFFLNGGERAVTHDPKKVDVTYDIKHVLGVYDDTPLARRGFRKGMTNYYVDGSFSGSTITLGASPGAAGTPVIVDYGAFEAHYLAADETVRQDLEQADRWAYLADPLLAARCLLDQIRAAGVRVVLATRL